MKLPLKRVRRALMARRLTSHEVYMASEDSWDHGADRTAVTSMAYLAISKRMLARAFGASIEASPSMILAWYNKATPTRLVEIWEKWAKSVSSIPAQRRSAHIMDLAQQAFSKGLPATWAFVVQAGIAPERTPGHGRAIDIARAIMRKSATGHAKKLTLGVWAKLGKLSTYGQKLALQVILPGASAANPVTPKDVNWEAVSKALAPLRGPAYRAFLYTEDLTALNAKWWENEERVEKLEKAFFDEHGETLKRIYPAYYHNMTWRELKRLTRGASLVDLAGGILSKKEAHAYFSERHNFGTPVHWLRWSQCTDYEAHLMDRLNGVREKEPTSETLALIRWLKEVLKNPAKRKVLLQDRTINHPVHGVLVYQLSSRLDEIRFVDLEGMGTMAPVQRVFENAARRVSEEQNAKLAEDHNVLCPAWPCKLPDGVQHLFTPSMLVAEGQRMGHCVGGYSQQVKSGSSHIFHIAAADAAATLELNGAGQIMQLYGFKNSKPTSAELIAKAQKVSEDYTQFLTADSDEPF